MTVEDPDIARRLAAADFKKAVRGLRDIDIPQSIIADDEVSSAPIDARTMIGLVMPRGDLTKRTARQMAEVFRKARARSPASPVYITFVGYDDDPRELWQFPEVCRYLKWWARFAGISDWQAAAAVPWAHHSWDMAFLVGCGVFGDDHPFTVELPPGPSIM
jgi:hypothetical protein